MTADGEHQPALDKPNGEPAPDRAIAMACSGGDAKAVAELFERYQIPVTRYLSRLTRDGDVEDLVQATFLQIARGKAKFDGRSSVRTWLFAIATNVMQQHFRNNARHRRLLWALSNVQVGSASNNLFEQIDARRSISYVRAAFESLSEKSRRAFLLCEVEGLSAREASEVLNASETAIWKRVSEVRKVLLSAAEDPQA